MTYWLTDWGTELDPRDLHSNLNDKSVFKDTFLCVLKNMRTQNSEILWNSNNDSDLSKLLQWNKLIWLANQEFCSQAALIWLIPKNIFIFWSLLTNRLYWPILEIYILWYYQFYFTIGPIQMNIYQLKTNVTKWHIVHS